MTVQDGFLKSEIQDDGRGFDPQVLNLNGDSPHGLGLLGIKERVSQWGGDIEFISQPGSGTLIRLQFPISEVDGG
jgi:signal transduction histidine kinase